MTVLEGAEVVALVPEVEGDASSYVKPPEVVEADHVDGEFVLYEAEDGLGSYQVDVWLDISREGEFWVVARELTTGVQLSSDGVKEATLTRVDAVDGNHGVRRFEVPGFTIFEGDAWEKYHARFELWFVEDGELQVLLSDQIIEISGYQF